MREIKFRAWTGRNMIFFDLVDGIDCGYLFDKKDSCDLYEKEIDVMQYSGLKDKNDAEICEGDFIKHRDGIFPVTWGDDIAAFECNSITSSRTLYGYQKEGVEVIGNVYESKDLFI